MWACPAYPREIRSIACAVLVILHISLKNDTFTDSHTLQFFFYPLLYSKRVTLEDKIMPNVNPRTNLTLKPELHDLIQETADHLGLKRAQLITSLLEEVSPQLEKMCLAFREIKEKQVDPSIVVSAFGAESLADILQSTSNLATELATLKDDSND